ncbi:MAG: cytochrome c [Bryobacterales bacterium]
MHRISLWAAALAFAVVAPLAQAQSADDGKELFEAKCAVCHNADSKDKKIGPGLAGIKDGKLPSGKEASEANMMENLNKGGNGMPAFEKLLSDEEKQSLIMYVKTL